MNCSGMDSSTEMCTQAWRETVKRKNEGPLLWFLSLSFQSREVWVETFELQGVTRLSKSELHHCRHGQLYQPPHINFPLHRFKNATIANHMLQVASVTFSRQWAQRFQQSTGLHEYLCAYISVHILCCECALLLLLLFVHDVQMDRLAEEVQGSQLKPMGLMFASTCTEVTYRHLDTSTPLTGINQTNSLPLGNDNSKVRVVV